MKKVSKEKIKAAFLDKLNYFISVSINFQFSQNAKKFKRKFGSDEEILFSFFCVNKSVLKFFEFLAHFPLKTKVDSFPEGAAAQRHAEPNSWWNMVSSTFL